MTRELTLRCNGRYQHAGYVSKKCTAVVEFPKPPCIETVWHLTDVESGSRTPLKIFS
jgi:hypothetical protein